MAAMCLVPPWEWTFAAPDAQLQRGPMGFAPIFLPPDDREEGQRVDFGRLFVQVVAVAALTGALILAAGGRGKNGT